jgi:hypothetical protein
MMEQMMERLLAEILVTTSQAKIEANIEEVEVLRENMDQ